MTKLLLLPALVFLTTCSQEERILTNADRCLEKQPETVISELANLNPASRKNRAYRALLLSRAMDKCYIDTDDDSLARFAVDYYTHTHDVYNQMRSWYCLGRVQSNSHDAFHAMISFEKATSLATKCSNVFWEGLARRNMVDILYGEGYLERACKEEERAVSCFEQHGDPLYLAYERLALARCYENNDLPQKADSILLILQTSLPVDTLFHAELHKSYASFLLHRKPVDAKGALEHYAQSDPSVFDITDLGNLAYIYQLLGYPDIADHYLHQEKESISDNTDRGIWENHLYLIQKERRQYPAAMVSLEASVSRQDSLMRAKLQQSLVSAQKDYFYQETKLLEKEQELSLIRYICAGILLLLALLFLWEKYRKKQKELLETMEKISELSSQNRDIVRSIMRENIDTLSVLADQYYSTESSQLQKEYFRTFKERLEAFRKHNANISFIEEKIDRFLDHAASNFKKEFPGGTPQYYKKSFLLLAGFPYSLISVLTNTSISTLRTEKSLLRKRITNSNAPHREDFLTLLNDSI